MGGLQAAPTAGYKPPLLDACPAIVESFPQPFEKHRRRLRWPQLSQFVFKLRKIIHCGCKAFFKWLKAYRYRDAAVFCEIPSAPAISLNVRSFQIFKTSTSRWSRGNDSTAAASADCVSSSNSKCGSMAGSTSAKTVASRRATRGYGCCGCDART